MRPGIHINRDEGFRLFDYNLATPREWDAAIVGLLDLSLDIEALKDRDVIFE